MLAACIVAPPSLGVILCKIIWGAESSFGILPVLVYTLGNWIGNFLGFPGIVC